jgi:hypothetical protein
VDNCTALSLVPADIGNTFRSFYYARTTDRSPRKLDHSCRGALTSAVSSSTFCPHALPPPPQAVLKVLDANHTLGGSAVEVTRANQIQTTRDGGHGKSSLGDAKSSLGDAKSSLGDAKRSLGDAKSLAG